MTCRLTKLIAALALVAAGLLLLLVWRNDGFDASGIMITALLLMALVYNWLAAMLFRRLEKNHPAKYREIGEPRMFKPAPLRNYWPPLRFLFTAEHKVLNDAMISRLVIYMRILWAVAFGMFVFAIVADRFFVLGASARHHSSPVQQSGIAVPTASTPEWDDVAYSTIREEVQRPPGISPPISLRYRYIVISPENNRLPFLQLLAERLRCETVDSPYFADHALVFTDTRAANAYSLSRPADDEAIRKCFVLHFRRRNPAGLPGEIEYVIRTSGEGHDPEIVFKQDDTGAARYQRRSFGQ